MFGLQWNLGWFISLLSHCMILTPRPHPSTGEGLSPPLGGDVQHLHVVQVQVRKEDLGDDMVAQREGDSFRSAGYTQFGQNVTDVGFDRGGTDSESSGNLRIVEPLDH